MEKFNKYDVSKLDIFNLSKCVNKRGELNAIVALLLFLYNKKVGDYPEVSFKYSEVDWMNYNLVHKLLEKLIDLKIITLISWPTTQGTVNIKLKTNEEIQEILNKDKRINFHKYCPGTFSKKDLLDSLELKRIQDHFIPENVNSWIRNINNEIWDLCEFLILAKIIIYFDCDSKIKTGTLMKYMGTKSNFIINKVRFLYGKIPINKKDVISTQFKNTAKDLKLICDGSFEDIIKKYLKEIRERPCPPTSLSNKN